MPIPSIREIQDEIPNHLIDKNEYRRREIIEKLATHFGLTPEELEETLPSGRKKFENRFSPALTYAHSAGLVESSRPGYWKISDQGIKVVTGDEQLSLDPGIDGLSPEGYIEENCLRANEELAERLLKQVLEYSPAFFEKLVVDLLVKMGYGGSRKDAGEAVGQRGDEGIDGVIKEDPLGLDKLYVQAKRWTENKVQEPEIARFAGALAKQGANKGIFITTSDFSDGARKYNACGFNIVLINGEKLVQLMIEHNVGVSTKEIYEIKQIDPDYFGEVVEE